MKSLDEQIEYMREEASYYKLRSSENERMRSIFVGNLETCQAILDTLQQLKLNPESRAIRYRPCIR